MANLTMEIRDSGACDGVLDRRYLIEEGVNECVWVWVAGSWQGWLPASS